MSGRIEDAKRPALSLPTWKGLTALWEKPCQPCGPREACHYRVVHAILGQRCQRSKYKILIERIRKITKGPSLLWSSNEQYRVLARFAGSYFQMSAGYLTREKFGKIRTRSHSVDGFEIGLITIVDLLSSRNAKRPAPWQMHIPRNCHHPGAFVYFRKAGENLGRHTIFKASNQTMLNNPAARHSATSDACSLENRNNA